jgi:hypothetical protein
MTWCGNFHAPEPLKSERKDGTLRTPPIYSNLFRGCRAAPGEANADTKCDSSFFSLICNDGRTAEARPRRREVRGLPSWSFVTYWLARLLTTFGAQILSVAVIWHI